MSTAFLALPLAALVGLGLGWLARHDRSRDAEVTPAAPCPGWDAFLAVHPEIAPEEEAA